MIELVLGPKPRRTGALKRAPACSPWEVALGGCSGDCTQLSVPFSGNCSDQGPLSTHRLTSLPALSARPPVATLGVPWRLGWGRTPPRRKRCTLSPHGRLLERPQHGDALPLVRRRVGHDAAGVEVQPEGPRGLRTGGKHLPHVRSPLDVPAVAGILRRLHPHLLALDAEAWVR